jgi:hypothetical protein
MLCHINKEMLEKGFFLTFLEQPNSQFMDILHEEVRFVTGEITTATALITKLLGRYT